MKIVTRFDSNQILEVNDYLYPGDELMVAVGETHPPSEISILLTKGEVTDLFLHLQKVLSDS